MDFALDLETRDIPITGGKLAEVTDHLLEVQQRVAIAYKTHLGEWPFDENRGLPWSEEFMVKGPDLNQLSSRLYAYTLTIEGVTGVRSLDIEFSQADRELVITVDIETSEGANAPFKVKVALP